MRYINNCCEQNKNGGDLKHPNLSEGSFNLGRSNQDNNTIGATTDYGNDIGNSQSTPLMKKQTSDTKYIKKSVHKKDS